MNLHISLSGSKIRFIIRFFEVNDRKDVKLFSILPLMIDILKTYDVPEDVLDEVYVDCLSDNSIYNKLFRILSDLNIKSFQSLSDVAKLSFLNQGITYALYNKNESVEQIFPFDLIPRILQGSEWNTIEAGIIQRNTALNMFLQDVYNEGKILKDKVVPKRLIKSSTHYCKIMENFTPAKGVYCHISGTDLIRHSDGNFYVLEDNLRSPSGVSYVLSNRIAMTRVLPQAFNDVNIEPVFEYTDRLRSAFWNVSGRPLGDIYCVLLTPGSFNSAYFEHTFLAQQMGIELVEGRDLVVKDDFVYSRSIGGLIRVDVVYRRIDDAFLDPYVFRPDSLLGVKGLMGVYLKGNVTIVNAPGTGISDDKAICSYVPDMIKYYLNEDPIIDNVPTYICDRPEDLQYVKDHIQELVVKPVDMSGGYGVCICDQMSKVEIDTLILKIEANPRNFIAQPKMMLSTHSTFIEDSNRFEPRHVDLRTYSIFGGEQPYVLPGGLTRIALTKGSLIVNSSQGGGSKDTWIVN